MKKRGRCCDSVYTNVFLGDNNWSAIRAALDKIGCDGWLVAEEGQKPLPEERTNLRRTWPTHPDSRSAF